MHRVLWCVRHFPLFHATLTERIHRFFERKGVFVITRPVCTSLVLLTGMQLKLRVFIDWGGCSVHTGVFPGTVMGRVSVRLRQLSSAEFLAAEIDDGLRILQPRRMSLCRSRRGVADSRFHRSLPKSVNDHSTRARKFVHFRKQAGGLSEADCVTDQKFRVKLAVGDHSQHPRILKRLHSVTPQQLKLATDDQSHWYSGIGVAASHQPHLDVSSTFAQAAD
jgi:hypothetical protein